MWELACLRWHHRSLTDRPRCLHRGQARLPHKPGSHIFDLLRLGYLRAASHDFSNSL